MTKIENQSIHPRVEHGRTVYRKVNTAAPRRNGIASDKLARMQDHALRHPNDGATKARRSPIGS